MDVAPELSIVIVTWNRKDDLQLALQSLCRQENLQFELILVDNGSTDGTLDSLAPLPPFTKILRYEENLGASVGRNRGIAAASTDLILFMDSDAVLLNTHTLRAMVDRMRVDPTLGGLTAPIYRDSEAKDPWLFGVHLTPDLFVDWNRSHMGLVEADALSTCFAVVPKRVCEETGGFDPFYFFEVEDVDFFMTVHSLGYRLEVLYGYPVWHRFSRSGRKMGAELVWQFRQEWRHQYLLLKRKGARGLLEFWRRTLMNPSLPGLFYNRPTSWVRFLLLFAILPLFMLALTPLTLRRRRRNHLELPSSGPARFEARREGNVRNFEDLNKPEKIPPKTSLSG